MDYFSKKPDASPKIYAFTEPAKSHKGLIRIGYTERLVGERMSEHYPTSGPAHLDRYSVLIEESSMRSDGTFFKDHEIFRILKKAGIKNVGGDWYECTIDNIKSAIISAKERGEFNISRTQDFDLRPEQKNAIQVTKKYLKSYKFSENKPPHFLWNCKMRFGKTFTTYKLAKEMNWKKILILTFKPAVVSAWHEDITAHKDFSDWQFVSKDLKNFNEIDESHPFACFASFQDFLGKNPSGGIKIKNRWAHKIEWDCIIFDEYHYGAWRDSAKELVESDNKKDTEELLGEGVEYWDEDISPLKTKNYLYLSGTPFRAISSGEFVEEQIFNWTYLDEQKAKLTYKKKGGHNPYISLPRMVLMTYQMPDSIAQIIETGEYDEFDLNEFFKAHGEEGSSKFVHEIEVQQWLNLIRGSGFNNIYTNLKLGKNKPILPFANIDLINQLSHTFWYLPSVASCYAMKNLMMQQSNFFYQDYEIIVCAGSKAGMGVKALEPVRAKMSNPLKSKTITLSCGKLNSGVTVKPWTGVFMLRNTTSPESYFQTAFRAQSPWTVGTNNLNQPNEELILKENCYIFDFAPNRALKLVTEYSCRLNDNEGGAESKVEEFIKFLPILCFDGSSMTEKNASEVIDIGMIGTSGPQLAKKFESARLVNVDDATLKKLMENKNTLDALMQIEGFRNIKKDIEIIINKTKTVNKIKIKGKKNKRLTKEEKEQKSMRKVLQEKVQHFATRIPVFMYLTDDREETLEDVITKIEPDLFKKVTSLNVKDFKSLISIGLFNSTLMNSAILAFKRYEDFSLHYKSDAGYITKHKPKTIGLYDTSISAKEFYSN